MVAHAKAPYITPEEYLEREHAAETKSEYFDGVIVAMAGSSEDHDRISLGILTSLYLQMRGKQCEPFTSNMRVWVPACNRYFYPDGSVVCGSAEFQAISGVQSLANPTLVVEVLSESAASLDRGDKLLCYQTLPSLKTYLIVDQNRPFAQLYERQSDGMWLYSVHEGHEAVLNLQAVECTLKLAEVYERVTF